MRRFFELGSFRYFISEVTPLLADILGEQETKDGNIDRVSEIAAGDPQVGLTAASYFPIEKVAQIPLPATSRSAFQVQLEVLVATR